jgi:hypothetical protein
MKVAIIGRGNASIITALVLISRGHDVEIYYDPERDHFSIGESTTPHIGALIYDVLGISISDLEDRGIVSFKTGVKFIGWGKSESFKHDFAFNNLAFHHDTNEFNSYIHSILERRGLIKYHPSKIENYQIQENYILLDKSKYDFVVNCSGWDDGSSYLKPSFSTVNSALIYQREIPDSDQTFTYHTATEDGWEFGLPFPKEKKIKCGYLFDSHLTSEQSAKKNSGVKDCSTVNWIPRYRKQLIDNPFVAYNGNKLFFIEPLQALSLMYYKIFAEYICNFLSTDRSEGDIVKSNYTYTYDIWAYQLSLAFHYKYGSKYDSKFWNNILNKCQSFFGTTVNGNDEVFLNNLIFDINDTEESNLSRIGTFGWRDTIKLYCGFTNIKVEEITNKAKW